MKKTYQNPEIKIVKVQPAQMIAASTDTPGYSTTQQTDETEGNLSRHFGGVWDDDED